MRRREFISVIVSATAWPLAARAQQPVMPVIGFLAEVPVPPQMTAAFRRGMAELGYVEGKNFATEYRLRPELLSQAAADLVRLNVNAIFAAAPAALAAVSNATTGIPVVGVDLESDPIAKGYVKSLGRPGGNVTGMFLDVPELSGKQVGLLKEIVPRLSRLAIFGVPGLNALQFAATETAARTFAVDAEITEVLTPADFEGAMDAARARHVDAGILLSSLRWPNGFPSFPCSANFQKTAVCWLMGRIWARCSEDAGFTSRKSCKGPSQVTCRYSGRRGSIS